MKKEESNFFWESSFTDVIRQALSFLWHHFCYILHKSNRFSCFNLCIFYHSGGALWLTADAASLPYVCLSLSLNNVGRIFFCMTFCNLTQAKAGHCMCMSHCAHWVLCRTCTVFVHYAHCAPVALCWSGADRCAVPRCCFCVPVPHTSCMYKCICVGQVHWWVLGTVT